MPLPSFRAEASARTWLLGIARRAAADAVRAEQRRRRLLKVVSPPRGDADATGVVEMLLSRLGEEPRAAFVLTQHLGLTYAEAADVCQCPIGTIRSRVARARESLQTMLTPSAPT